MSNMRNALIQSALQSKNFTYISEYVKKMNQRDLIIDEYCVDGVRMYTDDNNCIHIMCPESGMSVIEETSLTNAIVKGTIFDDAEEIDNTAKYLGSTTLPLNAITNSGLEPPKKLRIGVSAAIGKMDEDGNFKPNDTDVNNGVQLIHDIMHNDEKQMKPIDIVDNYIGNDEHKSLGSQMNHDLATLNKEIDDISNVDPENTLSPEDYKDMSFDDDDDDSDFENNEEEDDLDKSFIDDEDDDEDNDEDETIEENADNINSESDSVDTEGDIDGDEDIDISSDDNNDIDDEDNIDVERLSPIELDPVDYDYNKLTTVDDVNGVGDDEIIDDDMYNDEQIQESVFVTKKNISKRLSISLTNILNRISTFVINDSSTIRKLNKSIVRSYKYIDDLNKMNKIPTSTDEGKRAEQMERFYSEEEMNTLIELQRKLKIYSTCLNLKKSWIKTNGDKTTILNENPSPEYKNVYQDLEKNLQTQLKPMVEKAREIVNTKLPKDNAVIKSSSDDETTTEAFSYNIDNANDATIAEYNNIMNIIFEYKNDAKKTDNDDNVNNDDIKDTLTYSLYGDGEVDVDDDDAIQEGFLTKKPKKLKPIPVRSLVSYITIEMNAIKDSNDQAMIAAYTDAKLELIDFYIGCLDANDSRYIVPHSRQYLIDGQTQLNNLLTQILRIKPINKADRIWAWNV